MVLKINDKEHEVIFAYRTITFYGIPFQGISANQTSSKCSPSDYSDVVFLQPPQKNVSLGFSLFARRYWGNKYSFSFPPLTGMF